MVKNSRTPARPDQLRPLNTPRPISVVTADGLPVALIGPRRDRQEITDIHEMWCIDDEWWRDPIHRRYYRIRLDNGSLRTIYVDSIERTWHEQNY